MSVPGRSCETPPTVIVGVDGSGRSHRLNEIARAVAVDVVRVDAPAPPEADLVRLLDRALHSGALVLVDDAHHLPAAAARLVTDAARRGVSLVIARRPSIDSPALADLQRERLLGEILVAGSRDGMLTAAHDVSDGGVAQALVEMALRSGVGARVWIPDGIDPFVLLFSESAGRAVVVGSVSGRRSSSPPVTMPNPSARAAAPPPTIPRARFRRYRVTSRFTSAKLTPSANGGGGSCSRSINLTSGSLIAKHLPQLHESTGGLALDRPWGKIEQLCNLLDGHVLDIPQHDHTPLTRRQCP